MQFLKGLDQAFESRHALLHQPTLVSLDEATAVMSQEEVRLQLRRGDGNEYAYRVANQRGFGEFYNCSQTCHFNRFYKRDGGRGYSTVGSSSRDGWNGGGGPWNAPRQM